MSDIEKIIVNEKNDIRHRADVLRDAGFIVSVWNGDACIMDSRNVERTFYMYKEKTGILFIHSGSQWGKMLKNFTIEDGTENENFVPRYNSLIYSFDRNYKIPTGRASAIDPSNLVPNTVLSTTRGDILYCMVRLTQMSPLPTHEPKLKGVSLCERMPVTGKGVEVKSIDMWGSSVVSRHVTRIIKNL